VPEAGWIQAATPHGFAAGAFAMATVCAQPAERRWPLLVFDLAATGAIVALALLDRAARGGLIFLLLFALGYAVGGGIPITAAIASQIGAQEFVPLGIMASQLLTALVLVGSGIWLKEDDFGGGSKFAVQVFAPLILLLLLSMAAVPCLTVKTGRLLTQEVDDYLM
jgi:hypothetical protein